MKLYAVCLLLLGTGEKKKKKKDLPGSYLAIGLSKCKKPGQPIPGKPSKFPTSPEWWITSLQLEHNTSNRSKTSGQGKNKPLLIWRLSFWGSPGASSMRSHRALQPWGHHLSGYNRPHCRDWWILGQQPPPALASWLTCPPAQGTTDFSSHCCHSAAQGLCPGSGCQLSLQERDLWRSVEACRMSQAAWLPMVVGQVSTPWAGRPHSWKGGNFCGAEGERGAAACMGGLRGCI